jgi:hypothetical protein
MTSCASLQNSDVGVIKLHDDFIELNGKRFETTDALVNEAAKFSELHVNGHLCLNTSVLIEVMEKIKILRDGVIHIGTFGSPDDGTCH